MLQPLDAAVEIGNHFISAEGPLFSPHYFPRARRCSMRRVIVCIGLLALSFLMVPPVQAATKTAWLGPQETLLKFTPPAYNIPSGVRVANNWTFMGCWTPRNGSPCLDVFRDPQGGLWICKACGTTGNPGPGKCRRTTQAELDRGLWCS